MYDSERALKGKISIKYMWTPHKGDAVSFEPGYPVVNDEFTKSGKYNLTKVSHLSPRFIISPGYSTAFLSKYPAFPAAILIFAAPFGSKSSCLTGTNNMLIDTVVLYHKL